MDHIKGTFPPFMWEEVKRGRHGYEKIGSMVRAYAMRFPNNKLKLIIIIKVYFLSCLEKV